ncbi:MULTISPECIES: hypothetical protein [unclassified Mesorhizobium]|uniref:hypothetical protein n=1 Tax=unclassified Mesorhizobium TaxID=325217 RepID=UPI001FE03A2C|nr:MULTISPECIES: hypothetical protein [unclassified Mesorhizobium]
MRGGTCEVTVWRHATNRIDLEAVFFTERERHGTVGKGIRVVTVGSRAESDTHIGRGNGTSVGLRI